MVVVGVGGGSGGGAGGNGDLPCHHTQSGQSFSTKTKRQVVVG